MRKCVFVFVFVFVFVCGAPKLGGVTASGRDSYLSTLACAARLGAPPPPSSAWDLMGTVP